MIYCTCCHAAWPPEMDAAGYERHYLWCNHRRRRPKAKK